MYFTCSKLSNSYKQSKKQSLHAHIRLYKLLVITVKTGQEYKLHHTTQTFYRWQLSTEKPDCQLSLLQNPGRSQEQVLVLFSNSFGYNIVPLAPLILLLPFTLTSTVHLAGVYQLVLYFLELGFFPMISFAALGNEGHCASSSLHLKV